MDVAAPKQLVMREEMRDPKYAAAWRELAGRHALVESSLDALVGQSWASLDAHFHTSSRRTGSGGGGGGGGGPMLASQMMSTIKLRKAGFQGCVDSEEMLLRWVDELAAARVMPPV